MAAITFPHIWIKRGWSVSAVAGAAITEPYACVIQGATAGEVIESAAANTVAFGFIQEEGTAPASGDQVTVYKSGIVWAIAAGAISKDAFVETGAAGQVQAAGTGDFICGIARAAAAGANDRFPLEIHFGELA